MSTRERAATINAGDRLHATVRAIGVPFGRERSIKFRDQHVLANRFLLTVARDDMGVDATERVLAVCRQLGMPEHFLKAAMTHVTPANMFHFGFEEEHEGRSFYKVYFERGEHLAHAMASQPPVTEPFVLYDAFKWSHADSGEHVITRYVCHPRLERAALLQRVAAIYAGQAGRTPWHVICELVSAAGRYVPERELLYLDVTEDGTDRKSFDVNFYRARLRVASLEPFIDRLIAHFRLGDMPAIGRDVLDLRLGHIAGGVDRRGRDFLTIYYGAEAGG